jgi:gas vesicle protein
MEITFIEMLMSMMIEVRNFKKAAEVLKFWLDQLKSVNKVVKNLKTNEKSEFMTITCDKQVQVELESKPNSATSRRK